MVVKQAVNTELIKSNFGHFLWFSKSNIYICRYSFPKKEGKSPAGKSPFLPGAFLHGTFLPMGHFYMGHFYL